MAYIWDAEDDVEPISDSNIEGIANFANYAVVSGCAQTYSAANMNVTIASGSILHGGALVTVAGNSVTLVADASFPRWTWIVINNTGTAGIVSGDPAAIPTVPELGGDVGIALVLIPAGQTIANDIQYKLDKRVMTPSSVGLGGIVNKYKSSTQVFTTNTTFADVAAASGTFSFPIAANEVWLAEYWIPLAFGGTGGVKFQITGPAAPTNVDITGYANFSAPDGAGDESLDTHPIVAVTSFSSNIAAHDSAATAAIPANTYANDAANGNVVYIRARIINGANAGTVTLQAAQNSSNSTTTLGIGSTMTARRFV